ncbi:hypothetical protein Tco_0948757 [Tanacetum coccineum]
MIETNEFDELDENTDDNKETQTVVMDHVQNPLILEDDEVKSLSELEQILETKANNILLVNDDSESHIVNSEYVEFDSKMQIVKEVVEIIDDMQNYFFICTRQIVVAHIKCGEESEVHWWRRLENVVVGRRSYGGVWMCLCDKIEWKMKKI